MAKEDSSRYKELGYKTRVQVEYNELIDTTSINECIYKPNEEDGTEIEIDHWYVTFYPGKPDIEKTKEQYKMWKESFLKESVEGVEYMDWVSPEAKWRAKWKARAEALEAMIDAEE